MQLHLGNPSKRNRRALETAAADHASAPPADDIPAPPLDLDDTAIAHWRHLYAYLSGRNQLKTGDHYALARYCDGLAMYQALRAILRDARTRTGLRATYETRTTTGARKQAIRPEFQLLAQIKPSLLALERELGLTPSARGTVTGKLAEAKDQTRPPIAPKPSPPPQPGAPATPPPPASPISILASTKH